MNPLRDEVLGELRALLGELRRTFPTHLEFRGILDRAGTLVQAQEPRLQAFAELDLDLTRKDSLEQEQVLQTLMGAQHIPEMVHALVRVLDEEAQGVSLTALEERNRQVALRVDGLIHLWLLKNGGLETLLEGGE